MSIILNIIITLQLIRYSFWVIWRGIKSKQLAIWLSFYGLVCCCLPLSALHSAQINLE